VLIPKGEYNGQKETRLVNKNTAPRTSKVLPKNPETASVKNKYAKTIAATTRIPRSKFPMFFFIVLIFPTKLRDYDETVCNLYHHVINPADEVYHEVIDTEY
jgi:hypothetical protein